jgi:hypothetical protein
VFSRSEKQRPDFTGDREIIPDGAEKPRTLNSSTISWNHGRRSQRARARSPRVSNESQPENCSQISPTHFSDSLSSPHQNKRKSNADSEVFELLSSNPMRCSHDFTARRVLNKVQTLHFRPVESANNARESAQIHAVTGEEGKCELHQSAFGNIHCTRPEAVKRVTSGKSDSPSSFPKRF